MNSTSRWMLPLLVALTACQGGEMPPRAGDGAPRTLGLRSHEGMVSSANLIASEVGAEVLAQGGNAVDAAIATGFALAVVHPTAGNIGGGGFMVVRSPDGGATAIDFREKAPLAAHPEMFTDEDGEYSFDIHHGSYLAVGVPGTVAGFALAHERYGSGTPWADLVAPAVGLAGDGFTLSPALARSLANVLPRMEPIPRASRSSRRTAFPTRRASSSGSPIWRARWDASGTRGHEGFYSGETARLLAEEMVRGGGMITEEDLARYQAQERTPIHGTYRGVRPRLDAAPLERRHGHRPDAQHPGRLRPGGAGAQFRRLRPSSHRGDAPRLPRPGPASGRHRFRRRAAGPAHQQGLRGRAARPDRRRPGRPLGAVPAGDGGREHRDHALLGGGPRRHGGSRSPTRWSRATAPRSRCPGRASSSTTRWATSTASPDSPTSAD